MVEIKNGNHNPYSHKHDSKSASAMNRPSADDTRWYVVLVLSVGEAWVVKAR
jgi:hypothetical protein